jgi:curved DNA-binding protein CbpA
MAMTTLDPYATLGIPANAGRAAAAQAHRSLAKRFHPDVNPGPQAAERMRRINEAWRILSDPARRAQYDAERAVVPTPAHWAGSSPGYGPVTGSATWAAWPDDRRTVPRARRPARAHPEETSFGDRRGVLIAVWMGLSLLFFVGSWLGSLSP